MSGLFLHLHISWEYLCIHWFPCHAVHIQNPSICDSFFILIACSPQHKQLWLVLASIHVRGWWVRDFLGGTFWGRGWCRGKQNTSRVQKSRLWPKVRWTGRQDSSTPVLRISKYAVKNESSMVALSVYPVVHVQNVHFIHYSVSLSSSKQHNTKEIHLCEREPFTGRGPGTSDLRGAPSACRVNETEQYTSISHLIQNACMDILSSLIEVGKL